jgi:hypothetical protein
MGTGDGRPRIYGIPGPRPRVLRGPQRVAHPDNCVPPSAALLRRDVALAAGAFDPGLQRCADLDLWLRMLERGSGIALPAVTAVYHVHEGQVSADAMAMQRAHRAVLERYAARPWCTVALRRRYEGLMAWDARRAAPARTLRTLRDPRRLAGVPEALLWRWRVRLRSARVARDLEVAV